MHKQLVKDSVTQIHNAFYNLAYLAGTDFWNRLKGYDWDRVNIPHPLAIVTQEQAAAPAGAMGAMPTGPPQAPSSHPSGKSSTRSSSSSSMANSDSDSATAAPVTSYTKQNPIHCAFRCCE